MSRLRAAKVCSEMKRGTRTRYLSVRESSFSLTELPRVRSLADQKVKRTLGMGFSQRDLVLDHSVSNPNARDYEAEARVALQQSVRVSAWAHVCVRGESLARLSSAQSATFYSNRAS